MLSPKSWGGFTLSISARSLASQEAGLGGYADYLTAHEMGHSFFYDRSERPYRRRLPNSVAEERFCNLFARWLLIPSCLPRDAASIAGIVTIHRAYGVTLGAAAQSVVAENPGVTVIAMDLSPSEPVITWQTGRAPSWAGAWLKRWSMRGRPPARTTLAEGRIEAARIQEGSGVVLAVLTAKPATTTSAPASAPKGLTLATSARA
jgi:hypothetical protein